MPSKVRRWSEGRRRAERERILSSGHGAALLDCPFCGSGDVATVRLASSYAVACASCGASGPTGENAEGAMSAWNGRRKP